MTPLNYDLVCDKCGVRNRRGQRPGRDAQFFCNVVAEWGKAEGTFCALCAQVLVSDILHGGCELTLLAYRPSEGVAA